MILKNLVKKHLPRFTKLNFSFTFSVDRHIHSQRKQLSKVLTTGNTGLIESPGGHGHSPPIPVAINPIFNPATAQPLLMAAAAGMNNQHANIRNTMITPRPRGAAGIRGLGKLGPEANHA